MESPSSSDQVCHANCWWCFIFSLESFVVRGYNAWLFTILFLCLFFCLSRAAPMACGGSQPRGQNGVIAAGLHHSSLTHSQILNPQSKARDRTCVLMDASQISFHWATTGTPLYYFFFLGTTPVAYGGSQARGQIRAVIYITARATLDPKLTKWCQGSNLNPHGHRFGFLTC